MERLIERVGGLDVRIFETTAAELLALRDWLEAHGVAHVPMESTEVYWKSAFYVLEETFTCLLVNAKFRGARPTCRTASGSRSCWSTGCGGKASCRRRAGP